MLDERLEFRRVEEVLADVRAAALDVLFLAEQDLVADFLGRPHVAADVLLVLAVHHFHHPPGQRPGVVGLAAADPSR